MSNGHIYGYPSALLYGVITNLWHGLTIFQRLGLENNNYHLSSSNRIDMNQVYNYHSQKRLIDF